MVTLQSCVKGHGENLNELVQLRDSWFGRPRPRHGLQLLYWFANECISFDVNNEIYSECEPAEGDFGFHIFENRYDECGEKLLPDVNFPYYVVGNLNKQGAYQLPSYVKTYIHNSSFNDDSNTDRIIVSLDEEWFNRVYVTQHMDDSNYDPDATFRISRGLLRIIRNMNLEEFLHEIGYDTRIPPPAAQTSDTTVTTVKQRSEKEPKQTGFWDMCTIL